MQRLFLNKQKLHNAGIKMDVNVYFVTWGMSYKVGKDLEHSHESKAVEDYKNFYTQLEVCAVSLVKTTFPRILFSVWL